MQGPTNPMPGARGQLEKNAGLPNNFNACPPGNLKIPAKKPGDRKILPDKDVCLLITSCELTGRNRFEPPRCC